ncbi:uncharacterized protein LDX57_006674 [Aspergillus melleus]|uniref:uncharacterized protein n=1 Tax=Aspergillus melleus TaxID=138277 RepID=UPI001E8DB7BD|nr:uncharacterized protein LDX57_006674 [Aspergillus melleus]KAH8429003.1 hypothetical protein LDX57_006674 [Aspergillus melleus]
MCNQDCRGCSNCLSMASGSGGGYTYYHHSETVIVSNGIPQRMEPMTRTIRGSGNLNDIQDKLSELSMNSSSKHKSQSRRKSGVASWLDNIGEDQVVNSRTPDQHLLEAPMGRSGSRSHVSSSTHRSSRSRRSSRDDDDDMRTVVTLSSVTPSESASGISSRRSDHSHASRRSSHPESSRVGSRVSTRTRDDDESTIRASRPKDSMVSSRRGSGSEAYSRVSSRHPDDSSLLSSRHGGASTVRGFRMDSTLSSRHGGGSEITSRVGSSRHGVSEVGSRASTRHRRDGAIMLSSHIEDIPATVLSSRHPSETSSRRFSKDERSYVHPR